MRAFPFVKMHGCGNDFILVDGRVEPVQPGPHLIARLGDRHRGVGFDQLIVILADADADARLLFFNADGSEAAACGNGSRCAARLLGEALGRRELILVTAGGRLRAWAQDDDRWTVAMPPPRLGWQDVPLAMACDTDAVPLALDDLPDPVALSMGNPHVVFFVETLTGLDVALLGAMLERHAMFPQRANIGFACRLGPDRLRLRVFERGAGLTLACGSGACAATVAGRRRGLVGDRATVVLDGGTLEVAWPGEGPVMMTGPTAYVFKGALDGSLVDGSLTDAGATDG